MVDSGINNTYGSAFIGLMAEAILYGITLLQIYLYYRRYPQDRFFLKSLVFLLWFLETAHLVLATMAMYWYLISNYNKSEALKKTTWAMNVQTDCNGLIGLIVECFFARRVWIMSKNKLLTVAIFALACVHFGLGIVFTIESFQLQLIAKFDKLIWVTCAGLGSAAAADILIAVSLCYHLSRSRTGFARTDSVIIALIIYSLTTFLSTSVIAFICVLTFATMPTNYIWLAFFWVLGQCYVNSFMALLNSRDHFREKASPKEPTFLARSNRLSASVNDRPPISPLAVTVHTATVSKTDYLDSPTSATSLIPH